ncbi:MAG: sigma-54 dependent transcriptional regulator, partial [Bacteroidota bacterium]
MPNLDSIKRRYGIVGRSPALEHALNTALRVASSDLSVLIMGESGVGKEVISRVIHDNSTRKHEGFIAINCGALPEGTINSELFGHVKGAYTSSDGARKGYFETLDGGTIFLDEIGEMPAETQTYLLRVLENGEFIRMGSNKVQKTDVRVVAATNRKLLERVRDGKFREDLYYRLSTVPIEMPSLRERTEDIYLLFRYFANNFAEKQNIESIQLDQEARWLLEQYSWPGNIRELKNTAERLSILSEQREMTATDLAEMMPQLLKRNLPALRQEPVTPAATAGSPLERDILYKYLFEMKEDMGQLKALIAELIHNNNLRVSDRDQLRNLALTSPYPSGAKAHGEYLDNIEDERAPVNLSDLDYQSYPRAGRPAPPPAYPDAPSSGPIIVDSDLRQIYDDSEIVDEDLSLANAEKELIHK